MSGRVRYIEGSRLCSSGERPMDEDHALEQAEEEIRRLKIKVAELEADLVRMIERMKALKNAR